MELELCQPAPFIYYENGQIAVTNGASVWLVIVTCEAMKATAHPPEKSLRRLVRYAEYYRDLAATAIGQGEDFDGKVWVTDVVHHPVFLLLSSSATLLRNASMMLMTFEAGVAASLDLALFFRGLRAFFFSSMRASRLS